jgi:hypothetical protein
MVAAVLVGLLSIVMANMFSDSQKNQLSLNQKAEFDRLLAYTRLILGSRSNCGLDLTALSGQTFSLSSLPKDIVLDRLGANGEISAAYPVKQLALNPIVLRVTAQIETQARADALVLLSARKQPVSPGGPEFRDAGIPVVLELAEPSSGTFFVKGCTAVNYGTGGGSDTETNSLAEQTCELMGFAYDAQSKRCVDQVGSRSEAVEFLGGGESLKSGQTVDACMAPDKRGKMQTYTCEPNYSEHRTNASLNPTSQTVPELKLNDEIVRKRLRASGVCKYESSSSGGGQWYRGTFKVEGPNEPVTSGALLSQDQDPKRIACSSVQVSNISGENAVSGQLLTAKQRGDFSDSSEWWRNADKNEADEAKMSTLKFCYAATNTGIPNSRVSCNQTISRKGDGTFKSFGTNFCRYSKERGWQYYKGAGFSECKGGVSYDSSSAP